MAIPLLVRYVARSSFLSPLALCRHRPVTLLALFFPQALGKRRPLRYHVRSILRLVPLVSLGRQTVHQDCRREPAKAHTNRIELKCSKYFTAVAGLAETVL